MYLSSCVYRILIYDTSTFELKHTQEESVYDCVNSVNCHPSIDLIGTTSGQRHFYYNKKNNNSTNKNNNNDSSSDDSCSDSDIDSSLDVGTFSAAQIWKLKI
jgi:hypothetical protein